MHVIDYGMVYLIPFKALDEPNRQPGRGREFGWSHFFFSECIFFNTFPEGFLEFPGPTQGFKTGFGDCVVDSLVSSGLIEDLHRTGSHIVFFCQVIQSVVQSAEGERPPVISVILSRIQTPYASSLSRHMAIKNICSLTDKIFNLSLVKPLYSSKRNYRTVI